MSHSNSPRLGASADKRDGADFALGDLAVMLEQMIGAGPASAAGCALRGVDSTSMRQHVERIDVFEVEGVGAGRAHAFSFGPPSASRTVSREAPKPSSVSRRAIAAGASPSDVSARMRALGLQQRPDQVERPAMQRDGLDVLQRPAKPGGRQRNGRRRGDDVHLLRLRPCGRAWRRRRGRTDRRRRARRRFLPASASTSAIRHRRGSAMGAARPWRRTRPAPDAACRRRRIRPRRSAAWPRRRDPLHRPRRCRRW